MLSCEDYQCSSNPPASSSAVTTLLNSRKSNATSPILKSFASTAKKRGSTRLIFFLCVVCVNNCRCCVPVNDSFCISVISRVRTFSVGGGGVLVAKGLDNEVPSVLNPDVLSSAPHEHTHNHNPQPTQARDVGKRGVQ